MTTTETVQIQMPQMGESVTEGTVLEWHKQEGDHVEEGDTVVEVSTDKVDAEVPAPASADAGASEADDQSGEAERARAEQAAGPDVIQLVMPEMGESVTEGTILEWHKQEGDHVEEGDTVVEVSTDKVDAEIPA